MKFYITAVEYLEVDGLPVIHVVGRTDTGQHKVIKIGPRYRVEGTNVIENPGGFSPYFLVKHIDYNKLHSKDFMAHVIKSVELLNVCFFPETSSFDHGRGTENGFKLYTSLPRIVPLLRDIIEPQGVKTYEANVLYPLRFLIDTGIYSGLELDEEGKKILRPIETIPNMITWILDIEVISPEPNVSDPAKAKWPVCTIGIKKYGYDYSKDEFKGWNLVYDPKQRVTNGVLNGFEILAFLTEEDLFVSLGDLMEKIQPSNIIGHNIHWDMSYIIHRMKNLKLAPERLSPLGIYDIRKNGDVKLHGRNIIDGQIMLVAFYKRELPGYGYQSLGDIAPKFGGKKKDLPDGVYKTWDYDPMKVIDYNQGDLEAVETYLEKDHLLNFYIMLKDLVGARLEDTIYESRLIDVLLLRYCHGKVILPTYWEPLSEEKYKGAIVLTAKPGAYREVGLVDIKSSYPTAIRAFNISPETFDKRGDIVVREEMDLDGKHLSSLRFTSEYKGIIPRLIEDLLKRRAEMDAQKAYWVDKDYAKSEEYAYKSNAMKVLINAIYGVLKYKNFRLKSSQVGESIAWIGRVAFTFLKEYFEKKIPIIYGDTDSVFFQLPDIEQSLRISQASQLTKEANEAFGQLTAQQVIKTLATDSPVAYRAELKRIYNFFVLVGKKRYAGKYYWEVGKYLPVPQWDYKNIKVRSDLSGVSYYLEENIPVWMEAGLTSEKIAEIIKAMGEVILSGEEEPYNLAIPSRITKPFREYSASCSKKDCAKAKMTAIVPKKSDTEPLPFFKCPNCGSRKSFPAHVAGAYYSERYLGVPFKAGTKGRRLYISKVPESLPETSVILVYKDTVLPPGFTLNWERMWEATVLEKVMDFLGILNIPKERVYPNVLVLSHGNREDKPKEARRTASRPKRDRKEKPLQDPIRTPKEEPKESLMRYV